MELVFGPDHILKHTRLAIEADFQARNISGPKWLFAVGITLAVDK